MAYFTLAIRRDGFWSPEFGAFEKEDVAFERDCYRAHHAARDLKIVRSKAARHEVEAAFAKLNAAEAAK